MSDSAPSKLEDSDTDEEQNITQRTSESLSPSVVQKQAQHLPLVVEPASDYGVPWGNKWPAIVTFYMNNPSAFEYTGANLYQNKGEITALHDTYNLPRVSPGTLTLRILFAESAARQAARVCDPTEPPPEYPLDVHSGLQPLHPLNLALLPWDRLGSVRERTLTIGTSIFGPGIKLMVALDTLKKLSRYAAFASAGDHTAIRLMRHELAVVEDALLNIYPHEAEIYTNPKYAMQQLMIEAAKISGLVVIHVLSNIFEPTRLTCHRVDHVLTRAAMLNLEPLLQDYPKILLWALFLQAPFQDADVQKRYFDLASTVLEVLKLRFWEDTKAVLEAVYYYPDIQDKLAQEFWTDVQEFRVERAKCLSHEDPQNLPALTSE